MEIGNWLLLKEAWRCQGCGFVVADENMPGDMRVECKCERPHHAVPQTAREQRRYEIARDVMAAVMTNNGEPTPGYSERIAAGSVIAADALLAELEREDGVA